MFVSSAETRLNICMKDKLTEIFSITPNIRIHFIRLCYSSRIKDRPLHSSAKCPVALQIINLKDFFVCVEEGSSNTLIFSTGIKTENCLRNEK